MRRECRPVTPRCERPAWSGCSGNKKVRPAILIEVEHGQRLGIAGHNQSALRRRHRRKMPVPVARSNWLSPPSNRPTAGIGA